MVTAGTVLGRGRRPAPCPARARSFPSLPRAAPARSPPGPAAALHRVGEALAGHPQIARAAATAGPANLIATAVARSTADLYACLSGPLGHLEGVQHVEASPFLRRVKQLIYPRPVS
jgi:DNA-binding Lrp family transcriptional regulator